MVIWLLKFDVDKYNSFNGYEVEQTLNISFFGSSLKNMWIPPSIKAYHRKRKIADASGFSSGAPLFNEKAVEVLKEFLDEKTELLLSYFDNSKYYVVNVVNVIDALDYEKSEFRRFSNGEIMDCIKYYFKPQIAESQHIFKIPLGNSINIFVSDEFKKRVEEAKLKGFIFAEVWNSEESALQGELESLKEESKENQAKSKGTLLQNQASKEKAIEDFPEISVVEAKEILAKLKSNLFEAILQYVKETPNDGGAVDSIGLEYFFDGQFTDIGLRVNVLLKLTEDEYKDSYVQLLKHPYVAYDFNHLFNYYVNDSVNEGNTIAFFNVIQEIVLELNERMQKTKWENILNTTRSFRIEEPELYD